MKSETEELDYRCPECGHEDTVVVPLYSCSYVTCPNCDRELTVQHEGGLQRSVWFGWTGRRGT